MRKAVTLCFRSLLVAGVAATLAGCFETVGSGGLSSPGLTAGLDGQAAASRQAFPAGRATRAPTAPEPSGPPEYLTADKAKSDCWMQAETDKKAPKALDARGKWVEKCAAAKMREQATQWATPGAQSANTAAPGPSLPSLNNLLPAFATTPSSPPPAPADTNDSVMQKGM
jgi:hypothetical protein